MLTMLLLSCDLLHLFFLFYNPLYIYKKKESAPKRVHL